MNNRLVEHDRRLSKMEFEMGGVRKHVRKTREDVADIKITLAAHSDILAEHTAILNDHTAVLDAHTAILRQLEADVEASRFDTGHGTIGLPVKRARCSAHFSA